MKKEIASKSTLDNNSSLETNNLTDCKSTTTTNTLDAPVKKFTLGKAIPIVGFGMTPYPTSVSTRDNASFD